MGEGPERKGYAHTNGKCQRRRELGHDHYIVDRLRPWLISAARAPTTDTPRVVVAKSVRN